MAFFLWIGVRVVASFRHHLANEPAMPKTGIKERVGNILKKYSHEKDFH